MMIRRKPVDTSIERKIVTGMIISTEYLKNIIPIYKQEYSLTQNYLKSIADWCIEYFNKFEEAPKQHIQDIFLIHKNNNAIDDIETIELFLSDISDEYAKEPTFNVKYITDLTEKHFRLQALKEFDSKLNLSIIGGNVEEGENLIATFERVAMPETIGIDAFRDFSSIAEAFNKDNGEEMFSMPGDLGRVLGPFGKGYFVMVVAPMGRGKTWWLQEIALRGLFKGYNVLFVSLEMTKNQMIRRIYHRLTGLPIEKYEGNILIPIFDCVNNQDGSCDQTKNKFVVMEDGNLINFHDANPNYQVCLDCKGRKGSWFTPTAWYKEVHRDAITEAIAIQKAKRLIDSRLRGGQLKIITPPAYSINMVDLKTIISNFFYYDNWLPKVIVTDYLDKFAPEPGFKHESYRNKLYGTAIAHKALALELDLLIASGSQSNTGRDDNKKVGSGDFAEDIRKKAEIDLGWGLSQTALEKAAGIMNISVIKSRHDDFDVLKNCMVLQNLKIGNPILDSCMC